MNYNKITKISALTAAIFLMSFSLFAAGVKEISPSSTIAMIENVQANEDSYSFQVLSDTDEFTFTVINDKKSSIYNLDSYQVGDYIEINGLSNDKATSIVYITPLVSSGAISFIPSSPVIDVPEVDYGFNNNLSQSINYSYGFLIESNLVSQNTFVDASYFARGVLDATNADVDLLYTMDEMTNFYQTYSEAVQADQSMLPTTFGNPTEMDEILALGKTDNIDQQFAYTYGYMFAANFATSGFPIVGEYLTRGFLDGAYGIDTKISEYQMQNAVRDFEAQFEIEQAATLAEIQKTNLKNAETFLTANATAASVVNISDKLQYKVLEDAEGATPVTTDTVTLNYELSTLSGDVLDSSYQRGTPSQMPLSNVIQGFRDAVCNMNVGQTIVAWIHPDLGYGVEGNQSVEPNTLLMFKIGLISIEDVSVDATTPDVTN
jgi:FKBP-type peptidyl-prolyl cis-trans isomerase